MARVLVLPVNEFETIDPAIDYHVVPSLCPVVPTAYDFSQTRTLIVRAAAQTRHGSSKEGSTNGKFLAPCGRMIMHIEL